MTQEALKLALDALEEIHVGNMTPMAEINWNKAIIAIKEALAQPEQEPVAYLCEPDENGLYGLPLTEKTCTKCFPVYRHPQRTWVGLTDEEMTHAKHHMVEGAYQYSFKQGAKWAEARLKQKNGYAEEKNT